MARNFAPLRLGNVLLITSANLIVQLILGTIPRICLEARENVNDCLLVVVKLVFWLVEKWHEKQV